MFLNFALNSAYVLGALWGGLPGPAVCGLATRLQAAPAAAEVPGLEALAKVTAFINVNVVPMDTERVLTDQTVLVEGGRITALGPAAKIPVPAGAVRIDGQGKYLIPGLANMHPHGMMTEVMFKRRQQDHTEMLADGVTTIRNIVGDDFTMEQLRKHYREADPPSQRMYMSPKLAGAYQARDLRRSDAPPLSQVASTLARAKAEGYHHIGLMMRCPCRDSAGNKTSNSGIYKPFADPFITAFYDTVVAAAHRVGLPVAVHNHQLPFEAILRVGPTGGSIEHLAGVFWDTLGLWPTYESSGPKPQIEIPLAKIPPLASALRRAGVWVTPTLACMAERAAAHQHVKGISPIVKILQDSSVKMLLGFDVESVHDELAALVGAGLTPYQALLTGTRNVAEYLDLLDSSGTVAAGKWADLVLLNGNPLAGIQHTLDPAGVMIAGRWLDRAALDRYLLSLTRSWFGYVGLKHGIRYLLSDEKRDEFRGHAKNVHRMTDSLAAAPPSESAGVRQRLGAELGAMRAVLTTLRQRQTFDAYTRVWLREQARKGIRITVPGLPPTS